MTAHKATQKAGTDALALALPPGPVVAVKYPPGSVFPIVGIAADISPQRPARYFAATPDGSAYRINKGLRDLLIFSEHDLIK